MAHKARLDAETLARLAGLQLRVDAVVRGILSGLHRAPHRGSSVEFSEHKEYAPGDDLRHLDWKALARVERHYTKRYEADTELAATLMLDCSGSMGYGRPLSKLQYGSVLVGALTHVLLRQGDRPGLVAYDSDRRAALPCSRRPGQMVRVLRALDGLTAEGGTDLAAAVRHLAHSLGGRGLVIVVSDLLDTDQSGIDLLRHLRARGHLVDLIHLLHEDELTFPFRRLSHFVAMEGRSTRVLVDPPAVRERYLANMRAFVDQTRDRCREAEIRYHQVSTADPPDRVLVRWLRQRRP